MNLYSLCIILLLIESVKLDGCRKYVDKNNKQVDFETTCGAGSKPCLVKCCRPNEVIYVENKVLFYCMDKDKIIKEKLCKELSHNQVSELENYSGLNIASNGTLYSDFRVLYRKYSYNSSECPEVVSGRRILQANENATILENGELNVQSMKIVATTFCADILVTPSAKLLYLFHFIFDDNTEDKQKTLFKICCTVITSFFLLLTLVVYGMLEKLHSNLNGIMTMLCIASLLCVVIITASINFLDKAKSVAVCPWLAPILYYAVLSTFFWMNLMCYDIYRTIRSPRDQRNKKRGIRSIVTSKKFVRYALYAWGTPAAMTACAAPMDYMDLPESIIKPGFDKCFQNTDDGFLVPRMFQYLPVMVLVVANIVLFFLTIYNIRLIKQGFAGFSASPKQNEKNENQFILYLKLFVIMGVSWIIEVAQEFGSISPWLFYLVNSFNSLIGVVIFLVLIVKKDVLIKLSQRFGIENQWTRRSTHMKTTSRTDVSRTRNKAMEDSIQFESTTVLE